MGRRIYPAPRTFATKPGIPYTRDGSSTRRRVTSRTRRPGPHARTLLPALWGVYEFTEPFDSGSSPWGFDTFNGTAGTLTLDTTNQLHGAGCLSVSTSANAGRLRINASSLPTTGTLYARFYLKVNSAPSATSILFKHSGPSGANLMQIGYGTGLGLALRDSAGAFGSSHTLTAGSWYRVEAAHFMDTSQIQMRVWNSPESTGAADFDSGLVTSIGVPDLLMIGQDSSVTSSHLIDEFALSNVDWLGPAGALTPVEESRATTWNTAAQVSAARATTWSTQAQVAGTRATTWTARATVTGTRASSWAVAAAVAATRATTWTTAAQTAASRATTWSVLTPVTASRATTWNVASALTPVSASRATTWHVAAQVAASRATTWTARAAVTGTRASTWTVRSAVAPATRATTWTARAAITGTRSTTWNVRAALTSTRATTWHVRAAVAGSRATTWQVRAQVAGTRATTWRVLALVSGTRSSSWNVAAQVASSRAALWAVLASITATRSTTWRVIYIVPVAPGESVVVVVPTPVPVPVLADAQGVLVLAPDTEGIIVLADPEGSVVTASTRPPAVVARPS